MKYNHAKELQNKKIIEEMAIRRAARDNLNEGPWGQIAAGIAGAAKNPLSFIKGAKQGFAQQAGVDANEPLITNVLKQWNQVAGQIGATGTAATGDQFKQFLSKQFPGTSIKVPPNFIPSDPQALHDVVSQVVHQNSVNAQLGAPAEPTGTQPPTTGVATGPAAATANAAPSNSAYKQIRSLLSQLKDPSQIAKLLKDVTAMSKTAATVPAKGGGPAAPAGGPAAPAGGPAAPAGGPAAPAGGPRSSRFNNADAEDVVSRPSRSSTPAPAPANTPPRLGAPAPAPAPTTPANTRTARQASNQATIDAQMGNAAPTSTAPRTADDIAATRATKQAAAATAAQANMSANPTPAQAQATAADAAATNEFNAGQQAQDSAANMRRAYGIADSKINKKPSIAEARAIKKLQAKAVVIEMAINKVKRDRGII